MSVSIDKIEFKNYRQYGTGTIHFSTPGEYNLSVLIAKNYAAQCDYMVPVRKRASSCR